MAASEAFYTALLPHFTGATRPARESLQEALRVAFPLALAGTALYCAVVAGVSPSKLSIWLAFSPVLAATALSGVYAAFLTADRRYALAILRVALATGLALAIAAVVLPFWRSATAVALAVSAGQLLTLAVLAVRVRDAPRARAERLPAGDLLLSSSAVFAATIVGSQLVIVAERFLATGLAAGAVALLAFARGIALLPAMLAQAVGSGIFPAAAERVRALERGSLARLALTGMRLSILAGLVATAYVVICRRELVRIAFERHEFGGADAAETATLVAILAAALVGVSASAMGAKTLFALGRRTLVLAISAGGVALYVAVAVALRELYGLDGIAAAFTLSASAGGLAVLVSLVPSLELRVASVAREWAVAPLVLSASFAAGALAVWFALRTPDPSLAAALGTAVAVGAGGLAALAVAIRLANGVELSLARRATSAGGRARSS